MRWNAKKGSAYPTYDILMVAQMSLTVLASVDLVAIQVDIVCQTHLAASVLAFLRACSGPWHRRRLF